MKRVLCVVALSAATLTAQAPPITGAHAVAIGRWTDAVMRHAPGQQDDALMSIEAMTADDRAELRAGMPLFLNGLQKKPTRVGLAAEKRLVDLGNDFAHDPGLVAFVDRAIMLHGDAAMLAVLHPELAVVSRGAGAGRATGANPMLLERDGEVVGVTESNWNWALARGLARLEVARTDTTFLARWFHATSAFLMSRRQFGDAKAQLAAAGEIVPKDATIRFDRANFAEMQGLPESQALLTPEDIALMRAQAGTNMRGNLMRPSTAAVRAGIRPANVENADAERLFRSALDVDPNFVEARVRLARLLEVRGRHTEAAQELTRALATRQPADPVVMFFAHLFAGRIDRNLGRLDTAAAHFQEALALFPNAQSALLGASQVAVMRADVQGALAPIRQLAVANASDDPRMDPWWSYSIGLGRNADALLKEMWKAASR